LISIRNSRHNSSEEEDHIPLESVLVSIRNSIRNVVGEEPSDSIRSHIDFY
jgi:hypothetical protein